MTSPRKAFYITTTLPYVNADPHIGFALELVQADIIARYRALQGDDVFFSTGTDEHGLKIYQKAKEEGKEAQAYTDEYAVKFRKLKDVLGLDDDLHFIRTTDVHHVEAAQEIWRRCEKAGDIYKKKYKGLYCVGDEMFLKESDLVNGKCPNHPTMEPVEIEEENYFFALSKYQQYLEEYLSKPDVIVPEWRREEALNFVKQGLEDFSVSREAKRLPWGIPVPNDDSQVMYVWFDALTNYISTLGWPKDAEGNFKKFWVDGETLQLAGKDQVRFQSIMWQAMLKSAGLPATKQVFYHGFITSGGQKMSKSLGNVIDPITIVNEYGADALRHFLARHVHPFDDSDVTMERFKEAYNADLVNGLGNLVARVMQMASQYLDKPVDLSDRRPPMPVIQWMEKFEFHDAIAALWSYMTDIDELIQKEKPFVVVKTDKKEAQLRVTYYVKELSRVAETLCVFMPETARKIQQAIKENKKPDNLFPRKE
jgi:methionyl-tRNA synthetase